MDRESEVRWLDAPDNGVVGADTHYGRDGHAAIDRETGPNEDEYCHICIRIKRFGTEPAQGLHRTWHSPTQETRAQRFERRLKKFLA